jgi:hypothetical protein
VNSKDRQVVQPGERTNGAGKPVSNKILLSASDGEYLLLRPHLEYVDLPNHLVLHEAGAKLECAYFPNRGLISLVVVMKDGKTAEAGVTGNEGFTGTGGGWPGEKHASSGGANHRRRVSDKSWGLAKRCGIRAPTALEVGPLCCNSEHAGCADRLVQSTA